MEKNVGESLVFPPSPNSAETTNIPSSKEPNEQIEPEPSMVETGKSSENEPNPIMEFPFSSTDENSEFPKPIIMIVPAGEDIVSTILNYAHEEDVSILVHHASGSISEVNLSNPLSPSNDSPTFEGNMHMFFLSGVYTKCLSPLPPKNVPFSFFNVQFSVEHAPQIYGGLVGNKLVAAQPVPVTATIFKEHDYYEYHGRLSHLTAPNVEHSILSNDPNASPTTSTTTASSTTAAATTDNNNTVHDNGGSI